MLQCVECGAHGTVDDPTKDEWSDAFHSPSKPYHWQDSQRVTHRHIGTTEPYVIRATSSAECECYKKGLAIRPAEYERFPAEICWQRPTISTEERAQLQLLANCVSRSAFCSAQLSPLLVSCAEQVDVCQPPAVVEAANRIVSIHQQGMHLSPGVVAGVLRLFARPGEEKALG